MDIQSLLKQIGALGASDLHLVVGSPPMFRVSQELRAFGEKPLTREEVSEMSFSIATDEQKQKFQKEKELDFGYEIGTSRFRINLHYERGNVGCSIRRIPRNVPTRESLNLPETIEHFCNETRGIILVTGPTGSGKSTTQACMLNIINAHRRCHIVTIEDPIEYMHQHKKSIIEQREIGIDTFSFSGALKRVLRQDPDVILVGEMRDLETIQIAITAAETGHLVISTLHTPDAAQSIDRIIDVFPQHQQSQIRMQLSMALKGIVAQQLLPTKDGKGVLPVIEIMVATPAIRNIIRKAQSQELYSMIEIGKEHDMQSMDSELIRLYREGKIKKEDVINHAIDLERMRQRI